MEEIKNKNQIYYSLNKDKLQGKYKERNICPLCNKNVCKGALKKHLNCSLCVSQQKINLQIRKLNAV